MPSEDTVFGCGCSGCGCLMMLCGGAVVFVIIAIGIKILIM